MENVSIENATRGERRRANERMFAGGIGALFLVIAVTMMFFTSAVGMVLGDGIVLAWGTTIMVGSGLIGAVLLLFALGARVASEIAGDRKVE